MCIHFSRYIWWRAALQRVIYAGSDGRIFSAILGTRLHSEIDTAFFP